MYDLNKYNNNSLLLNYKGSYDILCEYVRGQKY